MNKITSTLLTLCIISAHVYPKQQPKNVNKLKLQQAYELFDQVLAGQASFTPAAESYQKLLQANKSFSIGPGMSLSQTVYNTAPTIYEPSYMRKMLYQKAILEKNPLKWITTQRWYALTSLPEIICNNPDCNRSITFTNISDLPLPQQEFLLQNIVENLELSEQEELTVTKCPYCNTTGITLRPQKYKSFSPAYQQAMAEQVRSLGVFKQQTNKDFPACRISLELADILQNNSDQIDPQKLANVAKLVNSLSNPLLFIHHYTNPQIKPYLFEREEDIEWFANLCAEIIKACPNVTHVCPISQPMGFARKVSRGMQPPFSISINFNKYFNNIAAAQKEASIAMKQVRPNLKVLLSHQWKPMKPKHTNFSIIRMIELAASKIADMMYNQKFASTFNVQAEHFDGIALSIYPAIYIDGFKVVGDNCTGKLDPHATLEAIIATHEAFKSKDIYIVETGCNCPNQERRKTFIDMTLQACSIASNMNISIKTCFFWTLNNDLYFYREWNSPPGSTNFGFFDDLDKDNPTESINESGKYLQTILASR